MIATIIAVFIALAVIVSVESVIIMFLWNYLAPSIIPLSDISFLQAVALTILSAFLFGGMSNYMARGSDKKSIDT